MPLLNGWRRSFAVTPGASRPLQDVLPFLAVVCCAVAPLGDALFPRLAPGPYDIPQFVRDRAALLWTLCWLPAVHYTLLPRSRRPPIPFLPIIGALYALYYALGPMSGSTNLWANAVELSLPPIDPVSEVAPAVDYALGGWVASVVGYLMVSMAGPPDLTRVRRTIGELRIDTVRDWSTIFVILGEGITVMQRFGVVPLIFAGMATLLRMLGMAGLIVLVVLARRRVLSRPWRLLVAGLAVACIFFELGGGATANVIYVVFCLFIALWISGTRIALWYYAAAIVAVAGFITIRGAMVEWRRRVWFGRDAEGPVAQSALMAEILRRDIEQRGAAAVVGDGWRLVAHRGAHSDLLADVMRRTPRSISYWDGYTYRSLVGAFVPRFLWPGKPQKTLGQEFGHRYGYLHPRDRHTSINLPVLVELYINFGKEGILLGMLVVGMIYGALCRVCNQPGQGLLMSAAGVQLFVPLFVMECDFSLTFGGMIMQLAALGGILHLVRGWQRVRHARPLPALPSLASIPADLPVPGYASRAYRKVSRRAIPVLAPPSWPVSKAPEMAAD